MVSKLVEELLKYGLWSGPGYTAGQFARDFSELGVGPILTPGQIQTSGIDAYDNFVAKAHDLNEVYAETQLRITLSSLGLISNDTEVINGVEVYSEAFQFGTGDEPRFVSYNHYKSLVDSSNLTQAQKLEFGKAFVNYFSHIQKSNSQYAVDHISNGVSVLDNGGSAISMQVQLALAAHIFLGESATIDGIINDQILQHFGSEVFSDSEVQAYLNQFFLTPEGSEFSVATNGETFTKVLTREQIISMSSEELMNIYVELRGAAMAGDPELARVVGEIEARGFEDFEEFIDKLLNEEGVRNDLCFAAGTYIEMGGGHRKPIEEIAVGDTVLAFDDRAENGRSALMEKRVTRTFATPDRLVIDFHGVAVTPGHVFLCGDGPHEGKFRMLLDILRDDGAIVDRDGKCMRAATNCPVGGEEDRFVEIAYITCRHDQRPKLSRLRAGTKLSGPEGEMTTLSALLRAEGYQLQADGMVAKPNEEPHPLFWFGNPPKPEDHILKQSGMSLEDLYRDSGYRPVPADDPGSGTPCSSGYTPTANSDPEREEGLFVRMRAGETLQ